MPAPTIAIFMFRNDGRTISRNFRCFYAIICVLERWALASWKERELLNERIRFRDFVNIEMYS